MANREKFSPVTLCQVRSDTVYCAMTFTVNTMVDIDMGKTQRLGKKKFNFVTVLQFFPIKCLYVEKTTRAYIRECERCVSIKHFHIR